MYLPEICLHNYLGCMLQMFAFDLTRDVDCTMYEGGGATGKEPPHWKAHPLARALLAAPAGAGDPLLAVVTRLLGFSPLPEEASHQTASRTPDPTTPLGFEPALQWLKPFLCFALLTSWGGGKAP